MNINVIADFRSRKSIPYYDPQNYSKNVSGMKIIPLQISELKTILQKNLKYKELYTVFETAFQTDEPIPTWYTGNIVKIIDSIGE